MKKTLILAGVAMMAIVTNAATYTWRSTINYTYLPETTTKASGTAYLFNAGTYAQSTLLTALRGRDSGVSASAALSALAIANAVNYVVTDVGGTSTGSCVGGTMASGQIKASDTFAYTGVATDESWNGYFAMIVGDNVYISTEKTAIIASSLETGTDIKFESQASASKAALFGDTVAYSTAGWYSTVPEPTSGLLMLLGMAGLALKRKRA